MKRFICTVAILLTMCVTTPAADGLTMDDAMDIILSHHGVEAEIDTIWNSIVP